MHYIYKILSSFSLTVMFWVVFHFGFYAYFLHFNSFEFFVSVLPYTFLVFVIGISFIYFMIYNIKVLKKTDVEKSKFEFIFNNSKDAIFITKIPENTIVECNQTALKLFNFENKNQIINVKGDSLHLNKLDFETKKTLIEKIANKSDFDFQFQYKSNNENSFFWGNITGSPITLLGNEYYLNRISDISSLKNQEIVLENTIKKFETIFNSSADALFIVQKENLLILDCNFKAVDLFEAENKSTLIGFDGTKLHVAPLTLQEIELIKQKNEKEEVLDFEFQYKTFKNKIFWGHLISTPIIIENKVCNLVRISDISLRKFTELKLISANEELKIANEELDSFVYRASHDLRSPLTSILGLLNVTTVESNNPSTIKYIPLMQQSVQKLLHVIDDLIMYSRNARIEIKPEIINFLDVINNQIAELNHIKNAEKITFDIQINAKNEQFYSDVLRIYILFSNLISNAIKYHDYNKENQFIKIIIDFDDIEAKILISDNGCGIPSDHIDKIFNMFYRANITSTGSGLGLYIVKGVIDKLAGKISVESIYKQGTVFNIVLPNLKNNINITNE